MSDSSAETAIFQELESLFAWNPLPFSLATEKMGGSFSTHTRDPAWYDMHLAPDRICKKLVYVKDLHKKIATVVDDKLRKITEDGIVLEPPTVLSFPRKKLRDIRLVPSGEPLKDEGCLQEYYKTFTADFCVPIASTLALHPCTWGSHIRWSRTPIARGHAICDGSLQILSSFHQKKRQNSRTKNRSGPDYIHRDLWRELMEVHEKYGDLATWEMKSLSVGDAGVMLGVVAMAAGVAEPFLWKTCNNPHHPEGKKKHFAPPTTQLLDDPTTMSKFGLGDPHLIPESLHPSDLEGFLDESLRRGGSWLKKAVECDRRLMAQAKGLYTESQEDEDSSSEVEDVVLPTVLNSGLRRASQDAENSPKSSDTKATWTLMSLLRFGIWKLLQDDQGCSTNTADLTQRNSRSATQKPLLDLSSKPFVMPKSILKRKTSRSMSPKKKFTRVQTDEDIQGGLEEGERNSANQKSPSIKQKTTQLKSAKKESVQLREDGDVEEDLEDDGEGDAKRKDPLTAQSIVQQAWSQGVRAQSTVVIIHSGNYEYVCIRHRETQTLYVSDILHVPFLENPGYGKLQIGIYLTAIDDALGRNRLEKSQAANDEPPGNNNDMGPGPSDGGSSDQADDDDDADEPKRKRRKGLNAKRKNSRSQRRGDKDWGTRQATSQDVLMVHVAYGVYDSIHPAVFNRGSRCPGIYGLCTPPPSPSYLPKENNRFELFLTSEIGERTAGILHGGVIEVESDKINASLDVTAKLAFTDEHKRRLAHESSMYTLLESKGVKGIPIALGIFSEVGEAGPSCFVTSYAGTSLEERKLPITDKQRLRFLAILESIHDAGILHSNLRLDNLLVNGSGDVAIVDFDEAKQCLDVNLVHKERQFLDGLLKVALRVNSTE